MTALCHQTANLRVGALAAEDSANYLAANVQAEGLTGYSADEITRLQLENVTPLPSTGGAREQSSAFFPAGTQRGEFELRVRQGRPILVRYWANANVGREIMCRCWLRVDTG
jgi:PAS domain-containing protein